MVIPVYRAETIIPALCGRLDTALAAITPSYEIILVDDRSPDGSWPAIRRMTATYPSIVAVRLSRNFGQHYAITAGLDLAAGEWVVIMDCDLQDQPEEIARLLNTALEGHDIVLARRESRRDAVHRRLSSRLFYGCFNLLSGYRMDPAVGSFRIMHRRVVDAYRGMREASRLFGGMIEWLGFDTAYVDVEHATRLDGQSSYNIRAMMKLALDGIIAFSNRPLYLSVAFGIVVSLLAAALGVGLVILHFEGPGIPVPGWLSIVTLNAFLGGLILLNLGIVGIYVGRIYDQTKGRPLYVVDAIVAHGQARSAAQSANLAGRTS